MRLHFILLVITATLLASGGIVSASADSAETNLSTMTATDTAISQAGGLNEVNGKRSLRFVKEDDADGDAKDEADEVRGITIFSSETTAKTLQQFLENNSIISKETSKMLKASDLSAGDITSMYAKYVKLKTTS